MQEDTYDFLRPVAAVGADLAVVVELRAVEDEAALVGGGMEDFVAEATEGRVVVRAEVVVEGPPRDTRGLVGLVILLLLILARAGRVVGTAEDEVDAALIRLFKPFALVVLGVAPTGRVGGLLMSVLFDAADGEPLLAVAELVEARAVLVVVGFFTGGAEVLGPGFVFSRDLILDATDATALETAPFGVAVFAGVVGVASESVAAEGVTGGGGASEPEASGVSAMMRAIEKLGVKCTTTKRKEASNRLWRIRW